MEKILRSNKKYKKLLGTWGEKQVDIWMKSKNFSVYKKNYKIRRGEIDRVYKNSDSKNKSHFCVSEIKTIYCRDKKRFFSLFTEIGLSSLVRYKQILNLYRYAEHLNARFLLKQDVHIHIRFFVVLKIYEGYENETFFRLKNNYKVCFITKNILILSFKLENK